MLTSLQLDKLQEEDRLKYLEFIEQGDTESQSQFEYFYGFTIQTDKVVIPTNKELQLYRDFTDTVKLKHIAQMLEFIPHPGQQPVFYTLDEKKDIVNNIVMVLGRRCGKSISTSVIAVRELAVPYSSTILLTPTFNNAKIIFNEVLKNIQKIKLPIKSINRGSFRFGSYNSLIIVDETQSVPDILEIMNQMLVPTLLDYGTRPSGILYGKQIYLGTPRGQENQLYDLYCNQDTFPNWKSFNAPSTSNPTLPTSYFSQMRLELGEMIYRQEILAEFFGADDNVFWAFNKDINTYQPGTFTFNPYMAVVSGIDIGFRDSTAQLWAYRDSAGSYYIDKAYQENMKSTQTHVSNYREIESLMMSSPEMRYIDPAAAQTAFDLQSTYDYDCVGANNSIDASIAYINQLLTPTGANNKPRLYINAELVELIRQISRVRWKDSVSKTSKDPFNKDPKGTHWDLIAALRYMLYSDKFNMDGAFVATSSKD